MKRNLFIIVLCVIVLAGCHAQSSELVQMKVDYGYVDSNGYIEVEKNNKKGYMNLNQEVVIPCIYDLVYAVANYTLVWKGERVGVVGDNNKVIIPVKYERITYVEDSGKFYARDKEKTVIFDKLGKKQKVVDGALAKLAVGTNYLLIDKDHKRAVMDTDGTLLTDFVYDEDRWFAKVVKDKQHDYALLGENGKMGVLNELGEECVAFIYDSIQPLMIHHGVFKDDTFSGAYQAVKDGKSGIIDAFGKVILPFEYDPYQKEKDKDAENKAEYIEGVGFEISKNGYYGIIDEKQNIIIPFIAQGQGEYDTGIQTDEFGYCVNRTSSVEYYTEDGVLNIAMDGFGTPFEGGTALVTNNNKSSIIDKSGTILSAYEGDTIKKYGKRYIQNNNKVIDANGKVILAANKEEYLFPCKRKGTIWFAIQSKPNNKKIKKAVLYDSDGKEVMKVNGVTHDSSERIVDGDDILTYDSYEKNKKRGLVLPKQKLELPATYESIHEREDYYLGIGKDGTTTLLDKKTLKAVVKMLGDVQICP